MSETLLVVEDLRTHFDIDGGGVVKAVDGVSLDVQRGEVFAIVGESGSGKSVTALTLMGLVPRPPARIESGRVLWKGRDLLTVDDAALQQIRGAEMSMVFQDPMTSLNPVMRIGEQVAEVVRIHEGLNKRVARNRALDALSQVGIAGAAMRYDEYPHQLSGGMRQRVMIAMAIVCQPDLLIADEPTTALDVTVQAQVLELLLRIQEHTGMAIMLITHDLGVVAGMADRVLVMYAGRGIEAGNAEQVFHRTRHPYTLGLLGSLPRVDEGGRERLEPIPGQPPSLVNVPPGCPFHPRCAIRRLPEPCATVVPPMREIDEAAHCSACHFAEDLGAVRV